MIGEVEALAPFLVENIEHERHIVDDAPLLEPVVNLSSGPCLLVLHQHTDRRQDGTAQGS